MTAKAPPPAPGGPDRDALERSLHKSYDRPTQAWVCGRVASGEPGCRLGPGPDGTCREKDSPCQPRRGRRQSLRRVSLLATLAALSIFAVAAGTRWRAQVFSPGPLLRGHAIPVAGAGGSNQAAGAAVLACADCHVPAASGSPGSWIRSALGRAGDGQSDLCQRCHPRGAFARKAHGLEHRLPGDETAAPWHADLPAVARADWRCASCHPEHRGPDASFRDPGERACRVCHSATRSFSSGHPALEDYPYGRGTNLRFDHNKHQAENFTKAVNKVLDQPFDCSFCHRPGRGTAAAGLRPFEETCARCHASQIAENPGIPVLTVPGLDREALKGTDGLGTWPNVDDSDVSPFLALLLSGDGTPPPLDLLDELDPLALGDASPEELEEVRAYARAVKRLFAELESGGHEALNRRVARALGLPDPANGPGSSGNLEDSGRSGADASAGARTGQLPPDTIRAANRRWFPGTVAPLSAAGETAAAAGPDAWSSGGWFLQDDDFTIRYRPARHADEFLRAWIDLAVRLAPEKPLARSLLARLTGDTAPGRCAKCHVVAVRPAPAGTAADAAFASRWRARPPSSRDGFTTFTHAPHLTGPADRVSCTPCHVLVADAPAETQARAENLPGSRDFVPAGKAACDTCHRPHSPRLEEG